MTHSTEGQQAVSPPSPVHSGRDEGGILADGVTGKDVGLDFEGSVGKNAAGVECQLGILGLAKRRLVGLQAEIPEILSGGVIQFGEKAGEAGAGEPIGTHSRKL